MIQSIGEAAQEISVPLASLCITFAAVWKNAGSEFGIG
jgi:hypothetical protein